MKRISRVALLIILFAGYNDALPLDDTPYDYAAIDRHADRTPSQVTRSIPALTAYLVKPAKNDREKARAMFRWISKNITYHIEAYLGEEKRDSSAEGVLKNRKGVCGGYARLFAAMAKEAGLDARVIKGRIKIPFKFDPSKPDLEGHAWNAVRIDGKWHALDATGGGSSFWNSKTKHYAEILIDFYFLIPPEHLRCEYFPDDPEWQMVKPRITIDEFIRLPLLAYGYWNHSLELVSPKYDIGEVEERAEIRLKGPDDLIVYGAVLKGDTILKRDATMDRSKVLAGGTFVRKEGGDYTVSAVFPKKEPYFVIINAKKRNDPDTLYQPVVIYKINVRKGSDTVFPVATPLFYEEGVTLISPLKSNFQSGRKVGFELKSKKAVQVMVVQDSRNYVMLEKKGDLFRGEFIVPRGDFYVLAKFSESGEFKPLLVYRGI